MTKIVGNKEIEENGLNPLPEYYDNLTNNPLTEIFDGAYSSYQNLISLKSFKDFEITIPVATIDMMFGTTTPGTYTITENHGVKGNKPFVFFYAGVVDDQVVVPEPKWNNIEYISTILNYNTATSVTVTLRAYIYQVLSKGSLD